MSSVLMTSTMKSPPLEVWLTGSLLGGWVSTATCRGPGGSALISARGAATCAWEAAGAVSVAAAPTSVALLRKLRRLESTGWRRLGMMVLPWGALSRLPLRCQHIILRLDKLSRRDRGQSR